MVNNGAYLNPQVSAVGVGKVAFVDVVGPEEQHTGE